MRKRKELGPFSEEVNVVNDGVERIIDNKKNEEKGSIYFGEMVNGERDGYGVEIFADGSIYEGMWIANKCQGKGRKIFSNLNVYTGMLDNNVAHG